MSKDIGFDFCDPVDVQPYLPGVWGYVSGYGCQSLLDLVVLPVICVLITRIELTEVEMKVLRQQDQYAWKYMMLKDFKKS